MIIGNKNNIDEKFKQFYKQNNQIKYFYEQSEKGLLKYYKEHGCLPNDTEWNLYALDNDYLSSYGIEYKGGKSFKSWSKKILKK